MTAAPNFARLHGRAHGRMGRPGLERAFVIADSKMYALPLTKGFRRRAASSNTSRPMLSHRSRPPYPFASILTIRRLAGAFTVCAGVALCLAQPALAQNHVEARSGPPAPVREAHECQVTRIVDGDTIDCAPFGRVRLIGMDTPEAGQEPFGDMATDALRERIPVGSVVELERDVEPVRIAEGSVSREDAADILRSQPGEGTPRAALPDMAQARTAPVS